MLLIVDTQYVKDLYQSCSKDFGKCASQSFEKGSNYAYSGALIAGLCFGVQTAIDGGNKVLNGTNRLLNHLFSQRSSNDQIFSDIKQIAVGTLSLAIGGFVTLSTGASLHAKLPSNCKFI